MKKIAYVSMAALTAVSTVAGATVSNADTVKENKVVELEVPVKLMNANENKESMGNGALANVAKVVENGDKTEIFLTFKGLQFMGQYGHLMNVEAYEDGKDSKLIPTTVVKEFKEKDLTGKLRTFPEVIKITRNKNNEKEIYLKVVVDAMASISANGGDPYSDENKNKGAQVAKLVLDYSKAKKINEVKPEIKPEENKDIVRTRIAGSNRFDTAVEISKKFFTTADTVVIANGRIYADALSASPLASAMKAPILLSESNSISEKTIDEIIRLKAKNIVIVGGEGSISTTVEQKLSKIKGEKDETIKVSRISGTNRYLTSLLVSKKVREISPSDKVLMVSGQNFADALSVSSLATEKNIPIVLTESKGLSSDVKTELKNWKIKEATVVGGVNSVSENVVKELEGITTNRIAGSNRYQTSVLVAKQAYPKANKIFVASGENPADALSVGAITGKEKSPLVLVSKNNIDNSLLSFVKDNKVSNIILFGGENSITNEVANNLK